MGMFDYINCRHPLPDGHNPAGERYQTKDTPNQYCDTYIIQENGTLTQDDKLVDFHGDLNFYACNVSGSGPNGYITEDDKPGWWREYVALFDHGRLLKIEGGEKPGHMEDRKHVSREEFWRGLK